MSETLTRRECLIASVGTAVGIATAGGWETIPEKEVPWLDEIQKRPEMLPADLPRLAPLLVDDQGQPINTWTAWQKKRENILGQWRSFLGSLKHDLHKTPRLELIAEDKVSDVIRQHVAYDVEPGLRTEAYLLRPQKINGRVPGVLVFHSTVNHSIRQPAGLGSDPEKAFGLKLAQQGCIAFCPRNFLWPDNEKIAAEAETKKFQQRHPQVTGMAKMLFDAIIATNILAGTEGVDSNRLGAVGHSLGAKEVLYLAAFDDRIKATVSSEGGIGTKFSNWDAPWYLGPTIKQPDFMHEHHELLALIAPRAFLVVGGESADGDRGWPFIEAALPVYRLTTSRPRLGQYNHRRGHAVPPESEARIFEWLKTYL